MTLQIPDHLSQQILEIGARNCRTMEDVQNFLKQFTGPMLEKMLQVEMDNHLGYEKHSIVGNNSGNSRNGSYTKKVRTSAGDLEIAVPRDREGEFEPVVVAKYQSNMTSIEDKIVKMYALGLSTQDISDHVKDIYGTGISADMISNITDKIMPQIEEYQKRPLEKCYPIIFLDAIHCKVRENSAYTMRAVYMVVGYDMMGHKDLLGFYIGESETSKYWMKVCSDLKNRGVEKICIACVDGLNGFKEAIHAVFGESIQVQKCIVHQLRNSYRFISHMHLKEVKSDLAKIYKAPNLEVAEKALEVLEEKRGKIYQTMCNSRRQNWVELSYYFQYPDNLRKLIYTTNIIESNNARIRKVVHKGRTFPTEKSLEKIMYLAIENIQKKWTMPIAHRGQILSQLIIAFPEISIYLK